VWWTRVRGKDGQAAQRSTETTDRATADEFEAMLVTLRARREWDLINAAMTGAVSLGRLYDHFRLNTLDALRAELADVDVRTYLEAWEAWAGGKATTQTAAKYRAQVDTLLASRPMLSDLTRGAVSLALAALPVSGSTKRRYHAAWSSFFAYLVEIGVVDVNPMRSIRSPKPNRAKELWLSLNDMIRVVEAQPEPFRSLSAFLHGAGVEISAALRVRVRDVDVARQTVRARGTKTHSRDRLVKVDQWAWPRVRAAVEGKHPDALLWPLAEGQERSERALRVAAGYAYRSLRRALQSPALADLPARYTLHDARHSYAVRHVKLGTAYPVIAHNLGHADELQVIKVYGKFRLSDAEVQAIGTPEQGANP
jgi:integrase